jgi:alkylation response protein AidB-like acyl-CoA dehydrogenase
MDELQTLILDTQQRLLVDWQNDCGHMPTPQAAERFWATIGETGLLGALAPESAGGLGHNNDFVFEFLRQWGLAAAPGTVIATLVGGAALLAGTQHEDLLAGIADGSVRVALPTIVSAPGHFPDCSEVKSTGNNVAWLPPIAVLRDAGFATHALLPAHIGAEAALLCMEIGRLALSPAFSLVDGATAAGLESTTLAVSDDEILQRGTSAEAAWTDAVDRMTAAAACEAVGLLRAMLDQTAAYVRQRQQFGKAIGSFQAIQHRMADMLVDVEQAHSLALAAIHAPDNAMTVSAAKVRVNRSLQYVADQSVQLHGGIGTTQELALNRYFRRALALAGEFGTTPAHLLRVEAALAARMHTEGSAA